MTALVLATRRWFDSSGSLIGIILGSGALLAAALYAYNAAGAALLDAASALPVLAAVLLATLGTALATGVGAVPVLVARGVSVRTQDTMLGFSAGVMLAASVFSLILPSIEAGTAFTGSKTSGGLITATAVALGGLLLLAMDKMLPHEHVIKGHSGPSTSQFSRVWLFVFAITLHNIPEGLAVGVAFAGEGYAQGLPLALGIAVQNMPEGLAVALALLTLDYTPARAALIALATGLVEPAGGLLGAGAIAMSGMLLPWGLAFAAGAMLFVISHEIIPESHRNGHETWATTGLFAGFVLMMMFDTMFA
ncbi:MAG: ZIP family metal transporter [Burkholderiales bacterium]|nr:ZIP family metal transporter [Burkholderiales bacterium]